MDRVSLLVVGSGQRGNCYSTYVKAYPDQGKVVAVCDPLDDARTQFADSYGVAVQYRFSDWRQVLDFPKLADAALICTQDAFHVEPAVALSQKGYHILLEKPMATRPEDCERIRNAVKSSGVICAVCHVLRYTSFNRKIKEIVDSGAIGKVHTIQLLEPVGYFHQAHSYVRGNWSNEGQSSPMLLAKSCHDLDLLCYFVPSRCARVSSFGSLSHFVRSNQPDGAADHCVECPESVESNCPYSALKIYLRDPKDDLDKWPVNVLTTVGTYEAVLDALRTGPYGRCVYACNNDVVDHQVVNLDFEDGATAGFTMSAFTQGGGRELYVMGDRGSITCSNEGIVHTDFLTDTQNIVPLGCGDGMINSGHGGGDFGLMKSFLDAVRGNDHSLVLTDVDVSLQSHRIVFAAERARKTGTVVAIE